MDHMGFLKHLRTYKAQIAEKNQTIGNLKRDADILTGNRDWWREKAIELEKSRDFWKEHFEKGVMLKDDALDAWRYSVESPFVIEERKEVFSSLDSEPQKPPYFDLDD